MAAKAKAKAKQAEKDVDLVLAVDGTEHSLSMDELTFREGVGLEQYFGCAVSEINVGSLTAVMYLTYIALHRTDPNVTLDDVMDRKVSDVEFQASDPKADASSEPPSEDAISGNPSSQS